MPLLQIHPAAEAEAHATARHRSNLQAAHAAAKARANKVCRNEPGVISKYALGEVIAGIEADQILHGELYQFAEAIALNRVLARLKALIPL